jgi:hypothetical protein
VPCLTTWSTRPAHLQQAATVKTATVKATSTWPAVLFFTSSSGVQKSLVQHHRILPLPQLHQINPCRPGVAPLSLASQKQGQGECLLVASIHAYTVTTNTQKTKNVLHTKNNQAASVAVTSCHMPLVLRCQHGSRPPVPPSSSSSSALPLACTVTCPPARLACQRCSRQPPADYFFEFSGYCSTAGALGVSNAFTSAPWCWHLQWHTHNVQQAARALPPCCDMRRHHVANVASQQLGPVVMHG